MNTYESFDQKRWDMWKSLLDQYLQKINKVHCGIFTGVTVEMDFDKKLIQEWIEDNDLVLMKDVVNPATKTWILWLRRSRFQ